MSRKGFTLFFDMREAASFLSNEELGEVIRLGLRGFPDGEEPSTVAGKVFYGLLKARFKREEEPKKKSKKEKKAETKLVNQYFKKSYQETLESNAKKMRENPTKAELIMKCVLCGTIGKWRFKWQHVLHGKSQRGYIADFYFPYTRTILEVDGGYHNDEEQKKKDAMRTKDLEEAGYKVFRISNEDVLNGKISPEIVPWIVTNEKEHTKERVEFCSDAFLYNFNKIPNEQEWLINNYNFNMDE